MNRRSFLLASGGALAGAGTVVRTGAFNSSDISGAIQVTTNSDMRGVRVAQSDGSEGKFAIEATVQSQRITVQEEAVALEHAGKQPQQLSIALVDSARTGLTNLATELPSGLIDFRFFGAKSGGIGFIDKLSPREAMRDRNDVRLTAGQYLDTNRHRRRAVPGVPTTIGNHHGSLLLEQGETATVGFVMVLGAASDIRFPDIRLDIGQTSSNS